MYKNRYLILIVLSGLILIVLGYIFSRNGGGGEPSSTKIEVLDASGDVNNGVSELVVEISGEVMKPGVYKLPAGSRIDDLLIASGGLSGSADRDLVAKTINRAAKLSDGQKIFIPDKTQNIQNSKTQSLSTENSSQSNLVNINTADAKTLASLPKIGQAYAQNIIEHRPYSDTSELVSKGAISNNIYQQIKDKISCY